MVRNTILKLLNILICKDNLDLFLTALCNDCKAKSVSIVELCEGYNKCYSFGNNIDIDELLNKIENEDIDKSNLIVSALYNKARHVGYLVVENGECNDTNYIVSEVSDYVAAYLVHILNIQNLNKKVKIDDLTGLYNRNEYIRVVKELKKNKPNKLGVVFIDINSLKEINDKQGHKYGDKVIVDTANIIRSEAREYGYRFGGDEFIVLAPNMDFETFSNMTNNLNKKLTSMSTHSVSTGISYRDSDIDVEEQIRTADLSMYNEKERYYSEIKNDRRKHDKDTP